MQVTCVYLMLYDIEIQGSALEYVSREPGYYIYIYSQYLVTILKYLIISVVNVYYSELKKVQCQPFI